MELWDQTPALFISSCVSLGKVFHLSLGFVSSSVKGEIGPHEPKSLSDIHNLWLWGAGYPSGIGMR